ncbi:hypothetical protein KP509_06G078300 [Ceratopteris richardii]|nr:hypothetical protein KP509_06G078300 [Ceratopteris richardii]
MVKHGLEPNRYIWFLLISMYANCGSFLEAHYALKSMPSKTSDAWTPLIASYNQKKLYDEALNTFYMMIHDLIIAEEGVIVHVLNASGNLDDLKVGMLIHHYAISYGHELTLSVQNSLLEMYCKCHCMQFAERIFTGMVKRNEASWTLIIMGYVDHGLNRPAMFLFEQMLQSRVAPSKLTFVSLLRSCAHLGVLEIGRRIHRHIKSVGFGSDILLNSILITMYARCGDVKEARTVFDRLPRKDITSWNAILGAYVHNSLIKDALKIFDRLKCEVVNPDIVTVSMMIAMCVKLKDVEKSKEVHVYFMKKGFKGNRAVLNLVLDMYIKCGAIEEARQLFDSRHKRDTSNFNRMIMGYIESDRYEEACGLFHRMQGEGIEPNRDTFTAIRNSGSITLWQEVS